MTSRHQDGDSSDSDTEFNPLTMLLSSNHQQTTLSNNQQQSYYLNSVESTISIRQLPSQGLSFQLWPAASTLVSLLDQTNVRGDSGVDGAGHISRVSNLDDGQVLKNQDGQVSRKETESDIRADFSSAVWISRVNSWDVLRKGTNRLRILELGSGTGLVGIAASAILGADVTLTDLPHVLPNIRFNADANAEVVKGNGGVVNVAALRWGEVEDMEAVGRDYDVLLGSDVVYHAHLYEPLTETLKWFLLDEGKKRVFVMAHLRRWKKESAFFKKAKKYFDIEAIHKEDPKNESRHGVVVYRFVKKAG